MICGSYPILSVTSPLPHTIKMYLPLHCLDPFLKGLFLETSKSALMLLKKGIAASTSVTMQFFTQLQAAWPAWAMALGTSTARSRRHGRSVPAAGGLLVWPRASRGASWLGEGVRQGGPGVLALPLAEGDDGDVLEHDAVAGRLWQAKQLPGVYRRRTEPPHREPA